MSAYSIALIFAACAIPALAGMWFAWRARARHDAVLLEETPALTGDVIERFPSAGYVSTTPMGAPFERVALPGLRYKGNAEVAVHRDGVTIAVAGEDSVRIPAGRILGSGTAGTRIGKAVERDGLTILRWQTRDGQSVGLTAHDLESSFRFSGPSEQQRFADAIAQLTGPTPTSNTHHTTLEDA